MLLATLGLATGWVLPVPLLVPPLALQAQSRFAAQQIPSEVAVGPRAEELRTADLDGDGLHDVVAASSNGGLLSYLASPGGRLRGPYLSDVGGSVASIIAVGDVNSDGIPDAVYRDSSPPSQLRWAAGDGSGRFGPDQPIAPMSNSLQQLELADMDGDGDLDVLAVTIDSSQVHLGDGAGGFTALAPIALGRRIAVGDLNGDGTLDGLFLDGFNRTSALGVGGGALVPMPTSSVQVYADSLALGDIDLDGDLDVVVGATGEYGVQFNDGAGGFAPVGPAISGPARTVALFDWNEDGILDLLRGDSVGYPDDGLTWSEGDGLGGFTRPVRLPGGVFPAVLPPVDVSGDGRADVVCGILPGFYGLTESGGWVENLFKVSVIVRGAGAGVVGRVESPGSGPGVFPAVPWRLAGDADGDGRADLISFDEFAATFHYRPGSASGLYGPVVSIALPFDPFTVDLADVDGDGIDDLFAQYENLALVRLGDGQGGFGPDVFTTLPSTAGPSLVDWNGDGRADVVQVSTSLHVSLGQPDGQFAPGASQGGLTGVGGPRAFADVDGDGDLDMLSGISGAFGTSSFLLVRGDGAGGFASLETLMLPQAHSIALGDLDGDGDADLAIGRSLTKAGLYYDIAVMLNDGSGTFGAPRMIEVGASPRVRAIADVDGDGRGEVLVTVDSGAMIVVGMGPEHQLAVDVPVLRSHHGLTVFETVVGVTDVDGDGRIDVVTHKPAPYGPVVLFNQGP
ncbi:MAG TPA: VCBS repeat-containing protein [Planctomycetota bacterium]|nr:VCBS repeat-containing protein [Planctomycetota bacterium]